MHPALTTHGYVENDNCKLHYWWQGSGGSLLFFIPGGTGHGSQYDNIISFLSSKYTCATYDRRGTVGSPTSTPGLLNLPQQADDVTTVVKALGFEKAIIFGNSLGGILAFQVAIDHPEIVYHLIAHEAPTSALLPDASEHYRNILKLHALTEDGTEPSAVATFFRSTFVGFDDPNLKLPKPSPPENMANFLKNEFLIASLYTPDFRKIVRSGISVGVLAGARSGDAFYARTTIEQAEILGCPRWVVPGHHIAHEVETEAFAPKLVEFIELLEKKRQERV